MRLLTAFSLVVVFLAVSGCQKVAVKNDYVLDPGDIKGFDVDPPSREQTVTVEVTTTGPVDFFIANKADYEDAIAKVKMPKSPLASKTGADKDASISAKVPAKAGYGVAVFNAKNKGTKVTLKMTAK
jgi:hypothetical protein